MRPSKRKGKRKGSGPSLVTQVQKSKKTKMDKLPKPVSIENEAKDFLEILRGDLTKEEFANEFWRRQPFVSTNRLEGLPKLLGEKLDLGHVKHIFKERSLFLRQDVCASRYDPESEEVVELEEGGNVTWEGLTDLLDEGWALTFPHLYRYSPPTLKLLSLFEKCFSGSDQTRLEFTLVPSGCHVRPPMSPGKDVFIFQLEGVQDVHVYSSPTNAGQEEDQHVVFGFSDVLALEQIDTLKLEKGDCLYIPGTHEYIYFRQSGVEGSEESEAESTENNEQGGGLKPNKTKKQEPVVGDKAEKKLSFEDSLDILVTIPSRSGIQQFLNLLVKEAVVRVVGHSYKRLPPPPPIFALTKTETTVNSEDFYNQEISNINSILSNFNQLSDVIKKHVQFQQKFVRSDFLFTPDPSFDIKEELLKNGHLVQILNFLPTELANRIELVLQSNFISFFFFFLRGKLATFGTVLRIPTNVLQYFFTFYYLPRDSWQRSRTLFSEFLQIFWKVNGKRRNPWRIMNTITLPTLFYPRRCLLTMILFLTFSSNFYLNS
eukprot:TRINITY_DN4790_c0_g2_i5.p1 TRINITY_DN4790_c0_g2~~TRINITY_DN4790_c0_g2_i5.p1  ORF type:complete len:544 (-),score=98.67 TRINITY_DN4790_c0_g2_i5:363-1994(-)